MDVDDIKVEEELSGDNPPQDKEANGDSSVEHQQEPEGGDENPLHSIQHEEEVIKKKYGGILLKKPPLISKDHERAFFDSADWALGKQGAGKPKGPVEALRPKLQPTPHQHMPRSAYAPADDHDEGVVFLNPDGDHSDSVRENRDCNNLNHNNSTRIASEDPCCQEKVEH